MHWQELTSPEIDKLDRDFPVVIPLASCEQHGRHLPLFVDTLQLDAILARVQAEMFQEMIALPTLWLGSSHHHLDFPGPISVRPKLYSEMIQQIAGCLLAHGFRRLFFLNGHGGNLVPASHALTDLIVNDDRADAATIALASWWSVASSVMASADHSMESARLTHACEYETSLTLAIREDLVKLAEITDDHVEKARPWTVNPRWQGKVEGFHRFHRWTSTGHMGQPESATKEKGQSLLEAVSKEVVAFLRDFRTWPAMEVIKK